MTQINTNIFKDFIAKTIGGTSINKAQANQLDIENEDFAEADVDENDNLDIDEILDNDNLYEHFATLYEEEKTQEAEAKDAEKEKEEQDKVQKKGEAGV